jgi:hypothetical protein
VSGLPFRLGDGDMVTIEWSGQPRLVVAEVLADGTWLRDLTEEERGKLDDAARDEWDKLHPRYTDADAGYDRWAFAQDHGISGWSES